MQWTSEAENAIKKVPFFVRKRVRQRVEKEAGQEGKTLITMKEVDATQQRYLSGMAREVKGYQLDACFGQSGCPHQIQSGKWLMEQIEALLQGADLLAFLTASGVKELKFHHEFRVTMADCPNACSQPQIKDIGIIGAGIPAISEKACSGCGACETACKEAAISLASEKPQPDILWKRCMNCGQCVAVCPSGTLIEGAKGYRVYLGGKLGRHPRLATALPGIYDPAAVLHIISACLGLYKSRSRHGQRFADLLTPADVEDLATAFASKTMA